MDTTAVVHRNRGGIPCFREPALTFSFTLLSSPLSRSASLAVSHCPLSSLIVSRVLTTPTTTKKPLFFFFRRQPHHHLGLFLFCFRCHPTITKKAIVFCFHDHPYHHSGLSLSTATPTTTKKLIVFYFCRHPHHHSGLSLCLHLFTFVCFTSFSTIQVSTIVIHTLLKPAAIVSWCCCHWLYFSGSSISFVEFSMLLFH